MSETKVFNAGTGTLTLNLALPDGDEEIEYEARIVLSARRRTNQERAGDPDIRAGDPDIRAGDPDIRAGDPDIR
ncbi:MAG: hypothetical protein AB8B86_09145 [Pseudomonadales bacterium]